MTSALETLLKYYHDCGVEFLTQETPMGNIEKSTVTQFKQPEKQQEKTIKTVSPSDLTPQATPDAYKKALEGALEAKDLETLKKIIAEFEGLSVKKTATQVVFADGNPAAKIMVIGEAPGADEDKQGKPFVGRAGQLLDKMFSAIALSRSEEDAAKAIYISNILNWRPPGNRTPTPQEMEISLPFIEKHIALIKPKIIVLMGATPAKTLLDNVSGITKIRGKWFDYTPRTKELTDQFETPIKTIATFHPAYLLRQPLKKRESWIDLLAIKKLYANLN